MSGPRLCDAAAGRLVVVDVQTRLAAAMPPADRTRVLRTIGRLVRAAALLEIPIHVTEQYPEGLGPTEPELARILPQGTAPVAKTGFSCCAEAAFREAVCAEPRRQVVLTGMEAHVCILQTALELRDLGLEVHVVEDAVCSRDPAHAANALARLRAEGVVVTNHESVLFEWLRDARHEHFKAVSTLLKEGAVP